MTTTYNDHRLGLPRRHPWLGMAGLLLTAGVCTAACVLGVWKAQKAVVCARKQHEFNARVEEAARQIDLYVHHGQILGAARVLGSANKGVVDLVCGRQTPDRNSPMAELECVRDLYRAAIVYVMDRDGLVVACTPIGPDGSTLTGNNYAFRPYFTQAIKGKDVVYPAVGVTTGKRGLYYASPIYRSSGQAGGGETAGVVVVKTDMERVDDLLGQLSGPALLVSPLGVVFAGNRPDWLFKVGYPIDPDSVAAMGATKQFNEMFAGQGPQVLPCRLDVRRAYIEGRPYAVATQPVALADETGRWTLVALTPLAAWCAPWTFAVSGAIVITFGAMAAATGLAGRRAWHARHSLRERERIHRLLFETSGDAILLMENYLFADCNARSLQMYGCSRQHLIGAGPWAFSPPLQPDGRPSADKAREIMDRAAAGEPLTFEWRHCRADGAEFEAEVSLNSFELSGRTYLQAIVRDVTARKRAEQAERAAGERMTQIIMGSPVPTLVIDRDHSITHWNKACENLTGIPAAEIVGTNRQWSAFYGTQRPILADLIVDGAAHEQVGRYYGTKVKPSPVTEGAYEGEDFFPDVCADGRWLLFTAAPLRDADGRIAGAIETFQNITERKRSEESLRRAKEDAAEAWASTEATNRRLELAVEQANLMAKEAVNASRAKSEFLANMSHEIRTPMNAIIGFSEVLAEEPLTDSQAQYVRAIRSSGNHLLEVINDILDFAKIEAGKLKTDLVSCTLSELLGELDTLMRPAAEAKHLDFRIVRDQTAPEHINTDPARVRQCLVNLVANAVKFTTAGHVHVHVSGEPANEGRTMLRFDVEDTGIGIPSQKIEAIFEAFAQADGSTTREYGGTGLGLTITRQLARLLGGNVTVRSQPARGSTFSLTILVTTEEPGIPTADNALAGKKTSSPDEPRICGCVLVAEDNAANQTLMRTLLSRMGIDVTVADDGAQAVERATGRTFDLIFMDMQMPVMNGYEATRALRRRGVSTPIVALTAHAIKGDGQECLAAGCNHYITKPFRREEMIRILRTYLHEDTPDPRKMIDSASEQVRRLADLCDQADHPLPTPQEPACSNPPIDTDGVQGI